MAGFAAAVFLGLMLTSCQGTQKAEQSGYKVFCRNAEVTALREVQYEPEAEGGEKLVEELLSAMEGTFNRNDYQSVFPEGLTAAVSTLKDGRLTIDFNDAYKQMDDTREVLLRAAVVQTMTQITDVREVVFTVAGEALLNSENQAVGPMHASSFINSEGDSINAYQYEALPLYFGSRNGTSLTEEMKAGFAAGVTLADGTALSPAKVSALTPDGLTVRVLLRQGVYHQIKRMFGVYGAGVNALHRDAIGGLALDESLAPGQWRELTADEVAKITTG